MSTETAMVAFHGHELLTIRDGGEIRVAMKPVCEAIGLDWSGQLDRIKRHPVLATCMGVMPIQMPGDDQRREVVTLPLEYLNGWLFGVDAERVNPDIRDRLIEYQRECFQALAAYWRVGVSRARSAVKVGEVLAVQRQVSLLLSAIAREEDGELRRTRWALLDQACGLLDIPTPPLSQFEGAPRLV